MLLADFDAYIQKQDEVNTLYTVSTLSHARGLPCQGPVRSARERAVHGKSGYGELQRYVKKSSFLCIAVVLVQCLVNLKRFAFNEDGFVFALLIR